MVVKDMESISNWLRRNLEEKKRDDASYSLRRFSKSLGIAPSSLSDILAGKRSLSANMVNRIVSQLNLGSDESKKILKIYYRETLERVAKANGMKCIEIPLSSIPIEEIKDEWGATNVMCFIPKH